MTSCASSTMYLMMPASPKSQVLAGLGVAASISGELLIARMVLFAWAHTMANLTNWLKCVKGCDIIGLSISCQKSTRKPIAGPPGCLRAYSTQRSMPSMLGTPLRVREFARMNPEILRTLSAISALSTCRLKVPQRMLVIPALRRYFSVASLIWSRPFSDNEGFTPLSFCPCRIA